MAYINNHEIFLTMLKGNKGSDGKNGTMTYFAERMTGYSDESNTDLQYVTASLVDSSGYPNSPRVGDFIIAQKVYTYNDIYWLFKITSVETNSVGALLKYHCTALAQLTGANGTNGADGVTLKPCFNRTTETFPTSFPTTYSGAITTGDAVVGNIVIVEYTNEGKSAYGYITAMSDVIATVNLVGVYGGNSGSGGGTSDESAFTSLAVGQSVDKLVFNPNVSVDKMTSYLASLPYEKTFQGLNSVTDLLDLGNDLKVWAINFTAFSGAIAGTSGYGIAIIDQSSGTEVLEQAIFASEYSEANVTLVNAIKDANYTLNYTQSGWSDTNDYALEITHTIASVHDNKVSAFIGKDKRFFEVVEMLDDGANDYSDLESKPKINGVELSGNKTSSSLKLGMQTASGGFQGGFNGMVLSGKGAAIGNGANTTNGGGAVGESAISQYSGGAVGQQAKETGGGGAIGRQTNTVEGGSIGSYAKSKNGFSGGFLANSRYAPDGTTEVDRAIAIGQQAQAQANDACQLGKGTNANEGTLQFRDYQLLDANGKIPSERLPDGLYKYYLPYVGTGLTLTPTVDSNVVTFAIPKTYDAFDKTIKYFTVPLRFYVYNSAGTRVGTVVTRDFDTRIFAPDGRSSGDNEIVKSMSVGEGLDDQQKTYRIVFHVVSDDETQTVVSFKLYSPYATLLDPSSMVQPGFTAVNVKAWYKE